MGHPFPACPSPFYALIHFITCIPSLLDSAVRTKLKQAFQENYHDHNMTNFNIVNFNFNFYFSSNTSF